MRLVIRNINWPIMPEYNDSLRTDMAALILDELKKKYQVEASIQVDSEGLVFSPTDKKGNKEYLFTSIKQNKVILTADSAMAKKLDRDYMKSHRLTKEQWEGTTSYITAVFDKLNLHADIMYYEDTLPGGTPVVIRQNDKTNKGTWPSPARFTV